jgi:pimeloyl-ACP methyl ester carboxylesterase
MTDPRELIERMVMVQTRPRVELFVAELPGPRDNTCLIIHGGPDWDHSYLLDPLIELAGMHRLLFVDLRGCGRSTKGLGDAAYTPEAATSDLVALLDRLELSSVDVLGFSYGGLVAQRLTIAAPAIVRRLIVASSSVLRVPERRTTDSARPDEEWTPEMTRALAMHTAADDVWSADRLPQYLERLQAVRFSADWSRPWRAGTLPSARLEKSAEQLAALAKPVLLLQGLHDRTFPAGLVARTLARVPCAQAVVIEGAGHMAHVDQPEQWLHAVEKFLA